MNQQVKADWIAALREYGRKQAHGALEKLPNPDKPEYEPGGQCCLGVLCELGVRAGVISAPQKLANHTSDGNYFEPAVRYDLVDNPEEYDWTVELGYLEPDGSINSAFLPKQIMKWAGLTENSPEVVWYEAPEDREDEMPYHTSLAELNDSYYLNFEEIATILEQNPDL